MNVGLRRPWKANDVGNIARMDRLINSPVGRVLLVQDCVLLSSNHLERAFQQKYETQHASINIHVSSNIHKNRWTCYSYRKAQMPSMVNSVYMIRVPMHCPFANDYRYYMWKITYLNIPWWAHWSRSHSESVQDLSENISISVQLSGISRRTTTVDCCTHVHVRTYKRNRDAIAIIMLVTGSRSCRHPQLGTPTVETFW